MFFRPQFPGFFPHCFRHRPPHLLLGRAYLSTIRSTKLFKTHICHARHVTLDFSSSLLLDQLQLSMSRMLTSKPPTMILIISSTEDSCKTCCWRTKLRAWNMYDESLSYARSKFGFWSSTLILSPELVRNCYLRPFASIQDHFDFRCRTVSNKCLPRLLRADLADFALDCQLTLWLRLSASKRSRKKGLIHACKCSTHRQGRKNRIMDNHLI